MRCITIDGSTWNYDQETPLPQSGSCGTIYFGKDELGYPRAIKLINSGDKDCCLELENAKYLCEINPLHAVRIFAAGEDLQGNRPCIVMEKADASLAEDLQTRAFGTTEVLDVLYSIVSALHEVPGLIHRDIWPSNILRVGKDWKLADWGNAVSATDARNYAIVIPQRQAYVAPEVREGKPVRSSDLYAIGEVLLDFGDDVVRQLPVDLIEMLTLCRSLQVHQRPSVDEVYRKIGGLLPSFAQSPPIP